MRYEVRDSDDTIHIVEGNFISVEDGVLRISKESRTVAIFNKFGWESAKEVSR